MNDAGGRALDEPMLLHAERDALLHMLEERGAFAEHVESQLAERQRETEAASREVDELRRERDRLHAQNEQLLAQLATLEKLRRLYRRVPGGPRMAHLLKRSLR